MCLSLCNFLVGIKQATQILPCPFFRIQVMVFASPRWFSNAFKSTNVKSTCMAWLYYLHLKARGPAAKGPG